MAIKFGAKSAKILRLGVGALTGSGLNYMVKAVNIPGMNTPIIPLTAGKSLNVDDVLELGVSGGILAYGYKKKNMTTKLVAGGMIAAGDLLLSRIQHFFKENVWVIKSESMEICFATLGEDAGIIGAAALACHTHQQGKL